MSGAKLFIPEGIYEELVNIIGQWKILDVQTLKNLCSHKLKTPNLLHKVRKLEEAGFIKGTKKGLQKKHVYLTNKGIRYTRYDETYEVCDEIVSHDIVTGKVLRELLTFENFINGCMFHQVREDKVFPDAEIEGVRDGMTYKLGLEVELTQKSSSRVKVKFKRYSLDRRFDYCLFVTNKPTLFKAYKGYLDQMGREIQEGIVLLLDET